MKKAIAFLVVLALFCSFAGTCCLAESSGQSEQPSEAQKGDAAGYVEQMTEVIAKEKGDAELPLRFYEETPHVPYIGMGVYSMYMKRQPLTLRDNGDGTCALVNSIGAEMECDPVAGRITVEDWDRFFDMPLPLEGEPKGWKDFDLPFVRIVDVTFDGDPAPVTLDFARYGIRVYVDQDDIYLPLSIVCNIMTDIATNHMLYNGEKLFAQRIDLSMAGLEGYFESEPMMALMRGEERPEDVVRECYADLCFTFDTLYGHPGKALLDDAISEKGLDQALVDLGEEGLALRDGLLSTDLATYLSSVGRLISHYLNDGHNSFFSQSEITVGEAASSNPDFTLRMNTNMLKQIFSSPGDLRAVSHYLIPMQRDKVWGSENYREYGNTAIIRLDEFMSDEAAWNSYYKGEGSLPEDCLGIVVSGLKQASENPEIENVILDLSCNAGGSSDMLMAILAMTTGQTQLYGIQKLTGRRMTLTYEVDANFDGVYDDRDKEARYDFNYGVLVTRCAFSCGNLFPIVIQEGGAVLIGEPSSGGSCCIQIGTDAEGFLYSLSSAQWVLTDSQGNGVEQGCSIDLPIEAEKNFTVDVLAAIVGINKGLPDFTGYFDDARLDEMMNAWFADQAQMRPAA